MTAPLVTGQQVSGFVANGFWNYFFYNSYSDQNLVLQVNTPNNTGDCDLFVKRQSYPTSTDYEYANFDTAKNFNITISQPGRDTWYIGMSEDFCNSHFFFFV